MARDNYPDTLGNQYASGRLSRRKMLQGAGAAAAVFVAGCSDDSEADGDTTPIGGGKKQEFHTFIPGAIESQSQIQNPWGNSSNYHEFAWMIHPHIARWSTSVEFNQEERHQYNRFVTTGVESLDIDEQNGTITIGLYDDWQWTSGDEVTADDLLLNLKINKYVALGGSVLWDNISKLSKKDDKTVVIELGEVNVDYATKQLFTQDFHLNPPSTINGKKTIFVEYLNRLEKASSDKEIQKIDQELSSDEDWPIVETVTCGPWKITDSTGTVVTMVPNEGFHSPVEFSARIENFDAAGGRSQPISAALSGKIEAGPLPQPEHLTQVNKMDNMEVVIRKGTSVQGLALNWNTDAKGVPDVYTEPKFRQAIAYILDNDKISRAHPTRTTKLTRADGVFFDAKKVLPNVHDSLRSYETDHKKAERLLKEVGLTKKGGTWHYDGSPLVIKHVSPNYHHWPTTGQATMSQLNQFGFKTQFRVNEQFGSILWGRSDDTWNSLRTHASALSPVSYMTEMLGEESMVYFPKTVEVPMPIGDWNGSLETVNVRKAVDGLGTLTGKQYTKQLEKLAWVHNYSLPSIPTNVENWGMMYYTDEWKWPAKDDPLWGLDFTNRSFMSIPAMSPK
jgi:peptide/nickel transport system substrate-binding protein